MPSLDIKPEQFAAFAEPVLEAIVEHLSGLPDARPYAIRDPEALAASLVAPVAPREGGTLDAALATIFGPGVSETFNTASGGYLAYVPGGGLLTSALGDLIASAINRYVGVWVAAPGLVQLERNVIRWFASFVGGDESWSGILTSGGSLANFSAVVTAREEKLGEELGRGVLYTSAEAHHSVMKAARLAGLPSRAVRVVPVDDAFRIDVEALGAAIAQDRAAGLHPFMVVANAGSTNTGAIDDLGALADLAAAEGLWLHVDGAYGGFFALTHRGRAALSGIARADSITLDPHKGLFLPYGNGCLRVRDGGALRRAHDVTGAYMPDFQSDTERPDFCSISPELSRPNRGLAVWLPLTVHGVDAFAAALDERIDLARYAAESLAARDDVELVKAPELSLFAFRITPTDVEEADLDDFNRRVLERVRDKGRVFLTGTDVGGRFLCRMCVLHLRTDKARVDAALLDIAAAIDEERAARRRGAA